MIAVDHKIIKCNCKRLKLYIRRKSANHWKYLLCGYTIITATGLFYNRRVRFFDSLLAEAVSVNYCVMYVIGEAAG